MAQQLKLATGGERIQNVLTKTRKDSSHTYGSGIAKSPILVMKMRPALDTTKLRGDEADK